MSSSTAPTTSTDNNNNNNNNPAAAPFELTNTDREVLAQSDADFHYHTWDELREIIQSNTLARLQRKPSALQAYLTWSTTTKSQHGSITSYILSERLHWPPPPTGQQFQTASPTPLSNPSDYKILPNDWPYSFSPGISHTVVWLKHRLPVDEDTGDLTPASKTLIEEFVQEKFVRRLEEALKGKEEKGKEEARERVMWFKNWTGLQSVRALEHFHVLGKDIPEEVLRGWRGGVEALGDEEG